MIDTKPIALQVVWIEVLNYPILDSFNPAHSQDVHLL